MTHKIKSFFSKFFSFKNNKLQHSPYNHHSNDRDLIENKAKLLKNKRPF